jgi:glycosyltransferase involved in cell wall biosynthesis
MPTNNRRPFVGQAIWYFLRQDYPHKELIVIDDGLDAIADLIPADERVRYVRLKQHQTIGAKRNLACQMSRGALVAHWDDDDWMSPRRLSIQVAHLLKHDADVCGARELLYYRPSAGEAWFYRYPDKARSWLAGGTLLYRRSAWTKSPFPEIDIGEDNAFVWQFPPERLSAVPDSSFYVALIHPGNTSAKNLADPRWQKRPLEEVCGLLFPDREFYAALRNGRALPRPPYQSLQASKSKGEAARRYSPNESLALCLQAKSQLPLVSCIMPTHNRRPFVRQAIEYFKRQDYPHRELIIVDDGTDPVGDLCPEDPSVRYIRLPQKRSTGDKRNYACEIARGEILVFWDDDDWYAPRRLSYQIAPLLQDRADMTGLDQSLVYSLPTRQFWSCTPQLHARMFYQGVVSGTLAFKKSLWGRETRFPDISEREDAAFMELLLKRGARLEKLTNEGVFVYVRHRANTWQFDLGNFIDSNGWQQVASPSFISERDCQFYGISRPTARARVSERCEERRPVETPDKTAPLVSCILATGNRRQFLKQAINYFQRQTYENKELIIIDDGEPSAAALVPCDKRIKYVRLDSRLNLGSKLNIGIENCAGEIIQKLDDDDYYHPEFLNTTAGALVGQDPLKTVVGFDCFLVLLAATGELKFSGHGWCAGGTLCFYRQLWEKIPFRDLPHKVDYYFLEDHAPQQIKVENPELFIYVRHGAGHLWTNMGMLNVTKYFQRQPGYSKPLAACLSPEDLIFYDGLREQLK